MIISKCICFMLRGMFIWFIILPAYNSTWLFVFRNEWIIRLYPIYDENPQRRVGFFIVQICGKRAIFVWLVILYIQFFIISKLECGDDWWIQFNFNHKKRMYRAYWKKLGCGFNDYHIFDYSTFCLLLSKHFLIKRCLVCLRNKKRERDHA